MKMQDYTGIGIKVAIIGLVFKVTIEFALWVGGVILDKTNIDVISLIGGNINQSMGLTLLFAVVVFAGAIIGLLSLQGYIAYKLYKWK